MLTVGKASEAKVVKTNKEIKQVFAKNLKEKPKMYFIESIHSISKERVEDNFYNLSIAPLEFKYRTLLQSMGKKRFVILIKN